MSTSSATDSWRCCISGTEYNGKLYPRIIVKTIAVWKKNEVKLAREAQQAAKVEDNKYTNHGQALLNLTEMAPEEKSVDK